MEFGRSDDARSRFDGLARPAASPSTTEFPGVGATFTAIEEGAPRLDVLDASGAVRASTTLSLVRAARLALLNPDGSPAALPVSLVPMGGACLYVAPTTASGEVLAGLPSCVASASTTNVQVRVEEPGIVCLGFASYGESSVTITCGPATTTFPVVLPPPTIAPDDDAGAPNDASSADAAPDHPCVIACGDASCVDPGSDPANCGGCGLVCAGTCESGRCIRVVSTADDNAFAIAANDRGVYWTDQADGGPSGSVRMAPADGGLPSTLATGQTSPMYITVDQTRVYWTTKTAVMAVSLEGGPPVVLASKGYGAGITVDAANLYWTSDGEDGDAVMKMPLDGGAPTTLVSLPSGFNPTQLVVGGGNVYFLAVANPFIFSVPVAGGARSEFFYDSEFDVAMIGIDGANVYYTEQSAGGPVGVCPLDGDAPTVIAHNNGTLGVVSDGWDVFFTSPNGNGPVYDGAVQRVPLDGGAAVTLATGGTPDNIAINATNVYWTGYSSGTVWTTVR